MTWSKAGESTNAFLVGAGDFGDNNVTVVQEYINFLVTRGWVVAKTVFPAADAPTNADRQWRWYIYKSVLCEDGGRNEWGYQIRYVEDVGNGDDLDLDGWDRGSDALSTGHLNSALLTGANAVVLAGKWSFWTSDLDTDSLFIMAGDGAKDQIFGFWPPQGTMTKQGGGDYNVKSGGLKLLTTNGIAYGSGSTYRDTALNFPFGPDSTTYLAGMNPQNMKLDLCIGVLSSNTDRRLFSSYGGDIHSYLNFTEGFQVLSTLASYNETNVYLIDGRYYIAWGSKSAMLFDCGVTAPAF